MSKNIIICDIDGTIANLQHRLHFIKNPDGTKKKKPDWDAFHLACVDDTPYDDVIEILCSLVEPVGNWAGREVYFFSGRNSSVRKETWRWLAAHVKARVMPSGFSPQQLQMRSTGDRRPDTVIKLEMMNSVGLTPDQVLCILDDRQAVVDMWRANGFRVLQVDAWKEEVSLPKVKDVCVACGKAAPKGQDYCEWYPNCFEARNFNMPDGRVLTAKQYHAEIVKEKRRFMAHELMHRQLGGDAQRWQDALRAYLDEVALAIPSSWRQRKDPKDIH